MKLIMELPPGDYDKGDIKTIDFRVEKLPISKDEKQKLSRSFLSGKGIIGKMPKSNKFLLFTPNGVKVLRGEPKDKSLVLPPDWQKYAIILKDDIRINKLREYIRQMVKEVLYEKK